MNILTVKERVRLAKLLSLASSNHDAEALGAARKAHQLLNDKNTTWPQVLGLGAMESEPVHVTLARDLLAKCEGKCTRWEMNFLREVIALESLTDYQHLTLHGLRKKVSPWHTI